LYTKLPGTKGLILAPIYKVFQLCAFCIFSMHTMFHNYTNILHITTTMMLGEKDVLTVEFFPFCRSSVKCAYFISFMFDIPFERSLSSNFCFFKICWKSFFTIIRDKQKIYVKKMEFYEDVCYSIRWYLNNRDIKFYLTQFSLTFSSYEWSQNGN